MAEGPLETAYSAGPVSLNLNNANVPMSPQSTRVTKVKLPDTPSQASGQVDLDRSTRSLPPSQRLAFTGTAAFKQQMERNELSLKLDRTVKFKQRIRHLEEQLKIAVIQNQSLKVSNHFSYELIWPTVGNE